MEEGSTKYQATRQMLDHLSLENNEELEIFSTDLQDGMVSNNESENLDQKPPSSYPDVYPCSCNEDELSYYADTYFADDPFVSKLARLQNLEKLTKIEERRNLISSKSGPKCPKIQLFSSKMSQTRGVGLSTHKIGSRSYSRCASGVSPFMKRELERPRNRSVRYTVNENATRKLFEFRHDFNASLNVPTKRQAITQRAKSTLDRSKRRRRCSKVDLLEKAGVVLVKEELVAKNLNTTLPPGKENILKMTVKGEEGSLTTDDSIAAEIFEAIERAEGSGCKDVMNSENEINREDLHKGFENEQERVDDDENHELEGTSEGNIKDTKEEVSLLSATNNEEGQRGDENEKYEISACEHNDDVTKQNNERVRDTVESGEQTDEIYEDEISCDQVANETTPEEEPKSIVITKCTIPPVSMQQTSRMLKRSVSPKPITEQTIFSKYWSNEYLDDSELLSIYIPPQKKHPALIAMPVITSGNAKRSSISSFRSSIPKDHKQYAAMVRSSLDRAPLALPRLRKKNP